MSSPVTEYELSGNWFDMGVELGRAERSEIVRFNERYFSDPVQMFRFGSMEKVFRYASRIIDAMRTYSENSFHFLRGLADGADVALDQAAAQTFLPELTHITNELDFGTTGCTACYVGSSMMSSNSAAIAQNWDFACDLPTWYVLRLDPPLDEPARLVVGAGSIFACCGVNSLGLAATFTSSGHLPNTPPGTGLPVVSRVLEVLGCYGFYKALDMAVAAKRCGAVNMLISDAYAHGAIIESTADRVEILEDPSLLICTNHFQHPAMVEWTSQDLSPPDDPAREFARASVTRSERIRDLMNDASSGGMTEDLLIEYLRDHANRPFSICAHPENTILGFRTVGSVILDPAQRSLRICPTRPCMGAFDLHSM